MGYRHYFYLADKSECEKVRNMTWNQLIDYAEENGVEVEEGHFYFNDKRFLKKEEAFEFGKLYWDDTADKIYNTGHHLFNNKEVQEEVSDYCPYVVGKAGLLEAIEIYKQKIVDYYDDMLVDGAEVLLPLGFKIENESIKSIDKIKDFIHERLKWWTLFGAVDLDEGNPRLSKSCDYEHEIFDLVRLLKTTDWDKKELLFYGW